MPTITVTREHNVDPARVRRTVESLVADLRGELGGSYAWQGDALRFTAPGAKGAVRVEPGRVTVEVDLGLLLRPLRGRIEDEIRARLERALA